MGTLGQAYNKNHVFRSASSYKRFAPMIINQLLQKLK